MRILTFLALVTQIFWSRPGMAHVDLPVFLKSANIPQTVPLTGAELSELAALYMRSNPDFLKLENIVAPLGLHVALYGGTSREITEEVLAGLVPVIVRV